MSAKRWNKASTLLQWRRGGLTFHVIFFLVAPNTPDVVFVNKGLREALILEIACTFDLYMDQECVLASRCGLRFLCGPRVWILTSSGHAPETLLHVGSLPVCWTERHQHQPGGQNCGVLCCYVAQHVQVTYLNLCLPDPCSQPSSDLVSCQTEQVSMSLWKQIGCRVWLTCEWLMDGWKGRRCQRLSNAVMCKQFMGCKISQTASRPEGTRHWWSQSPKLLFLKHFFCLVRLGVYIKALWHKRYHMHMSWLTTVDQDSDAWV